MRTRMMLLAAAAILIVAAPAMAFHDGGVADCQGCHTMHNSQQGGAMNFNAAGTGPGTARGYGWTDLLLYPNASDVCLSCHGGARSYNVFDDVANITTIPLSRYYSAGNFVFLLEDNINDGHAGASNPITGNQSGHNILSYIKGSVWDPQLGAPPSDGTSPLTNNQLQCSSCHDPHGQDGFRLLYQTGQSVDVGSDTVTFLGTVDAEGIPYGDVEYDDNHNAYFSGYSEWCSSCHVGFHAAAGNLIHPSGQNLTQEIADKYNAYIGTTDCVDNPPTALAPCGSGTQATAYLADVPFEDAGAAIGSTVGPTTASEVGCMTCHRAHATSARDAGRWDFQVTLLDEDGDESGSFEIPRSTATGTFYADANQRSLCNKCHTQDEFDHLPAGVVPPSGP